MKTKKLIIKFIKPLDKRQEAVLIVNFKALIKEIDKELAKRLRQLDSGTFKALMVLPTNRLALGHIKERMRTIRENLTQWFKLYKTDEKTYIFEWQEEDLKLIKKELKALGRSIKLEWGGLVKEQKLIEGLKCYVLPDMGLQPNQASFEVLEIEQ